MATQNLGQFFEEQCSLFEEKAALSYLVTSGGINRADTVTYGELIRGAKYLSEKLQLAGLGAGDRCAIFANSSVQWVVAFIAIQLCGGVDVTGDPSRGYQTFFEIISQSGARFCFLDKDRAHFHKNLANRPKIILLNDLDYFPPLKEIGSENYTVDRMDRTKGVRKKSGRMKVKSLFSGSSFSGGSRQSYSDIASIIYKPFIKNSKQIKGVALAHANILKNIDIVSQLVPSAELGSIGTNLPFWRADGRAALLFSMRTGAELCLMKSSDLKSEIKNFSVVLLMISSKDANYLSDLIHEGSFLRFPGVNTLYRFYIAAVIRLAKEKAIFLGEIPEFFDAPFLEKMRAVFFSMAVSVFLFPVSILGRFIFNPFITHFLGKSLRAVIAGGESVSMETDFLFSSLGISVFETYYLAEASHVIACRVPEFDGQKARQAPGTVGPLLPETEIRLIDQHDQDVSTIPGATGKIYVRGPQIMQGYYLDVDSTNEVLGRGGWLFTGDEGRLSLDGELQITKRESWI